MAAPALQLHRAQPLPLPGQWWAPPLLISNESFVVRSELHGLLFRIVNSDVCQICELSYSLYTWDYCQRLDLKSVCEILF